jgi:predicted ferric reductase
MISNKKRTFYGIVVFFTGILMLAGVMTIPFYFPSATVVYKFGWDKVLLQGGKIMGLFAGCLLLFQLILGARLKFLDRIFGLNSLVNGHRINSIFIGCCAGMHPMMILASEGMWTIPLEFRYWPEFAGVFSLMAIAGMALVAWFRIPLGLPFHRWRVVHILGGAVVIAAVFMHIRFVSDTYAQGLPRQGVLSAAGLCFLLFLWVRIRRGRTGNFQYRVVSVTNAAQDAVSVKLEPVSKKRLCHAPGQFAFVRFHSPAISREAHPFTLASSPVRPCPELIIRKSGDWTRTIGNLKPGDACWMDGPYGLFTHLRFDRPRDMLFIAGGIGVTPMLSMLRYMADTHAYPDDCNIVLIWSNRTRSHMILPDTFDDLKAGLKNLTIHSIFTREARPPKKGHRLDATGLKDLLGDVSRTSRVFVCGPEQMVKDIFHALKVMGFKKSRMFMERFSL